MSLRKFIAHARESNAAVAPKPRKVRRFFDDDDADCADVILPCDKCGLRHSTATSECTNVQRAPVCVYCEGPHVMMNCPDHAIFRDIPIPNEIKRMLREQQQWYPTL